MQHACVYNVYLHVWLEVRNACSLSMHLNEHASGKFAGVAVMELAAFRDRTYGDHINFCKYCKSIPLNQRRLKNMRPLTCYCELRAAKWQRM